MDETSKLTTEEELNLLRRKFKSLKGAYIGLTGVLLVFFGIVATRVVFLIPKFLMIFDDLLGGTPMPVLTQFFLGFSDNVIPILIVVLAPALLAVVLLVKFSESPAVRLIVSVVLVYLLLVVVLIPFALFLPLIQVIVHL